MSQGSGSGPAAVADYEGGMQENQLAVWLRNVPTWLDEDRFFEEIEGWLDVDKDKSYCFKNKQDSNWVGIRYGWAIVTFKSKRARNKYLEDEDRHFVRETENSPYEKLKVSPWFDKPKAKQPNKSEKTNKIPLYKSDLEKEVYDQSYNFFKNQTNLTVEEFTRGCTDTSIQVFKGRVSSYIASQAGQPGHVGDLEILLSHGKAELVIFHSDTVWLPDHTGIVDSPVRCGVDNFLENRLQVGTDVWFTARRLPTGIVEGRRFQAKSVWQGNDSAHPSFVSPPPIHQLDLFLQDYTSEVVRSRTGSKAATPDSESSGSGSTISPQPQATTTTVRPRPKPLKGGLNQLNSSQEKSKTAPTLKKPIPTNFAQAVSAVPTLIREEHSNLTLALGFVETISSDVEATVSIPDHGNFSLHINHLDLGYKLSQPIGRYLSPKVSTLTVTLKQIKPVAAGKPKYELVRAHINEDKKPLHDKFDPFTQDYKSKKSSPVAAVDTWEDLADAEAPNDNQEHSTEFEIDLDELDQYYDDLQGIIEYLEKELPKVIPRIANDEKCFQTLANKLLSHTRGHTDEAKELQGFLDNYPVSARIKNIFISEYVKFRSKNVEEQVSTLSADSREKITTFLNWLKTVVKNKDLLNQKIDLYTKILENNWVVLSAWQEVVKEKEDQNFLTFINKSKLGEEGLTQFRSKLNSLIQVNGSGRDRLDWGTVVTWLESDTNNFRLEGTKSNQVPIINTESAESSLKIFKIYETSNFEKEFLTHQDKAKETTVFMVRAIVLLRKSEIKFEGLHKLHLRHLEENPNPRNRELIVKITSILNKQSSQKMLDDINATIQRRLRRDTAISYRRFDKYIHILAQNLANFFVERFESRPVKLGSWTGEREKIQRKQETEVKVEELKDKKSSAVDSVDQSENFSDIDYVGLKNFLELSVASGRVRLPATATIEAIIWTFRAANIPHCRLEAVYNQCREVGGCSWQLQVSQLGLNPPLGLAVPDLAEYLSAYFGSLKNTSIGPVGEDDLELLAGLEDDEEDGEDVEEEDVVVEGELEEHREPELLDLTSCWPGRELLEMQKMFVFSELGGMTRPLLRSNWAAGLNTSDLEKERILNQTFQFFQSDRETLSMIEFITPCVERAGLRNAMKVLNQHYPGQTAEQQESELDQNDTDSEKRQSLTEEGEEEAGKVRKSRSGLARNRQLSTDTIKDETLWLAETNLEQLWADEAEQGKGERMLDLQEEDLAEVSNDSEEYFEDENSSAKEVKQLGAIGSSKPKVADVSRSSSNGVEETSQSSGRAAADKESPVVRAEQSELVQRAGRVEEAVCNLSAWQPMASDIISGNRDLIVQLASRVEYLESALNQLTLSLATQGGVAGREGGGRESGEARKAGGGRSYVRIVKEGAEEEVAEVPTNSAGLLPHTTVLALYEGTSAIKYRLSSAGPGRLGAWRALLLEDECYHPPEEGWGEREYICTAPQLPAPALPEPPLQFGLGATSLASPFLGLPPLQHIWGTPGLAGNSQTTGSVSQSVFGNMQNMGALNSLGGGGSLQKHFPSNAGKK